MASSLTTSQMLDAIRDHSAHLAKASRGHFDAPVPSCGSWTVGELVQHVIEVQWSWGTRAILRISGPQIDENEQRPPTDLGEHKRLELLAATTERMIAVLDGDEKLQQTPVWTWAPDNQTIGFITRHQVQEAAVHDYDVSHATGSTWTIDASAAADSVDEFLRYSIASSQFPASPETAPLGTGLVLVARDTGDQWLVTDGAQPGTLQAVRGAESTGELVEASAGELLLWLYGRIELATVPPETAARFRNLVWTD